MESKTITTRRKAKRSSGAPATHKEPDHIGSSEAENRDISDSTVKAPTAIHIHVDLGIVERFAKGYLEDKDFALVLRRTQEERLQDQKYCAYCLAENGLMYFEDADGNVRLCVPSSERSTLI